MLPQARAAWLEVSEQVGNASSLHTSGRAARRVVESARESIAEDLGIRPSAVIFTGGGTESDNLAIKGLYWARCAQLGVTPLTIVTSAIEHHAVLDPVMWLSEHEGAIVEFAHADVHGWVSPAEIERVLMHGGVALVSIMWANNEIGAIQPVHEISKLCKKFDVPFHTDAVQAIGQLQLNLRELDAAAVTISSHKIGGPVGVGALIVDPTAKFTPVLHGGGQEREIRSGTLDPASIAAFAAAVRHTITEIDEHSATLRELQEYLVAAVVSAVPGAILNGPTPGEGRLPNNTHFSFPGCEGDSLLMLLDAAGIDCSTGSACTAGIPEPSHVLLSMGVDEKTARASLRFSLGRDSSKQGIDQLAQALPSVVERAQRAGSVSV
jgi:cysteine desulfurase